MRLAALGLIAIVGCGSQQPPPPVAPAPAPPKALACPVESAKDTKPAEQLTVAVSSGTLPRARDSVAVCSRAIAHCADGMSGGVYSRPENDVELTLEIEPDGKVGKVLVHTETELADEWQQCVEGVARELPFDAPGARAVVVIKYKIPGRACNPGDPICY